MKAIFSEEEPPGHERKKDVRALEAHNVERRGGVQSHKIWAKRESVPETDQG